MRMKIPDEHAIQSLIAFGARHRMVLVWWLMKNRSWVGVTPGFDHAKPDKNALALEIFAQYMAQVETLEMTYFALRDKVRRPRKTLLATYQGIQIAEHFQRRTPSPKEYSGRRLLFELRGISVRRFQESLGLPTYEELVAAACGKQLPPVRMSKHDYHQCLRQLIQWIRQAVRNKTNRPMVKAFMKMKHGFPVLGHPESDELYVVLETKQRTPDMCVGRVLHVNNTDEVLAVLDKDTSLIGWMVIELFSLYLRRNPWERCEGCKGCADRESTQDEIP